MQCYIIRFCTERKFRRRNNRVRRHESRDRKGRWPLTPPLSFRFEATHRKIGIMRNRLGGPPPPRRYPPPPLPPLRRREEARGSSSEEESVEATRVARISDSSALCCSAFR